VVSVVEPVRRRVQDKFLDERGYAFAKNFLSQLEHWLTGSGCTIATDFVSAVGYYAIAVGDA
jgi:hypothetical protein